MGESMKGYRQETRKLMSQFTEAKVERVLRIGNCEAKNLAKIMSFGVAQSAGLITIEYIAALVSIS